MCSLAITTVMVTSANQIQHMQIDLVTANLIDKYPIIIIVTVNVERT